MTFFVNTTRFRLILDKLLDGGLIVTDGSSNYLTNPEVPWKGFWEKKANDAYVNLKLSHISNLKLSHYWSSHSLVSFNL